MKKLALIILTAISLIACSKDDDIQYSVNSDLAPYVDEFYSLAAAKGKTIPKNLVADLKAAQAETNWDRKDGQNYFYYDKTLFTYQSTNGKEDLISKMVIAGLGKVFLNKYPTDLPANMSKEQVIAEIFGN
jgi:hypothetical protein